MVFVAVIVGLTALGIAGMLIVRDAYKGSAEQKVDIPEIIKTTLQFAVLETRKVDIEYEKTLNDRRKLEVDHSRQVLEEALARIEEEDSRDHIDDRIFQPFGFDPADPNAIDPASYRKMMSQTLNTGNLVMPEDEDDD